MKIELLTHQRQTIFNIRRWTELVLDKTLAKIEGRIETDRHGRVVLNRVSPPLHGMHQAEIGFLIDDLMLEGRVIFACPLSTADGVKAADVAWASPECIRNLGNRACFPEAPEICVEVLSPGNTQAEIEEKMALYFDAGAKEVWICSRSGAMRFYDSAKSRPIKSSRLCPAVPKQVRLP